MFKENNIPVVMIDFLLFLENTLGRSANTIKNYRCDLIHFLKFIKGTFLRKDNIDNIDITDINTDFINRISIQNIYSYVNYLSKYKDNTAKSRARKIAAIKAFYKYLYKVKLIKMNIAIEIETPKIKKRNPIYLTVDESNDLLDTVRKTSHVRNKIRNFAIIIMFLNTGIRIEELVNLNIDSIDKDRLSVIGKGDKERVLYLNNITIDTLNAYLKIKRKGNEKALFLSERGTRISKRQVSTLVKKYSKLSEIHKKITAHKLRHTLATLLFQNGEDIRVIQDILGHESISTTEIYTHVNNEQVRAALKNNPLNKNKNSTI